MAARLVSPTIAGAVLFGRGKGIQSLRDIAEASLGPVSDALWQRVEKEWAWHNSLTSDELRADPVPRPPTDPRI
jgi:hypothetical protein